MTDQANSASSSLEVDALTKIRRFSLLSIVGFLIATVSIIPGIILLSSLRSFTTSTTSATPSLLSGSPVLAVVFGVAIVSAVILFVAFLSLRSGYRILKGISTDFNSAYTGTTLYIVGLVIIVLGSLIIIATAVVGLAALIVGAIIILIGAIMAFIGTILALIVGTFRLNSRYGGFTLPAVFYVVGIFFSLFSFIAAILVYTRTGRAITKLKGGSQ